MGASSQSTDPALAEKQETTTGSRGTNTLNTPRWQRLFGSPRPEVSSSTISSDGYEEVKQRPEKWSFGVLNDRETEEVPGM